MAQSAVAHKPFASVNASSTFPNYFFTPQPFISLNCQYSLLDPFLLKLHQRLPSDHSMPLVILNSLAAFHLASRCGFNLSLSLPPGCQMPSPCAWSQPLLPLWKIVTFGAQVTLSTAVKRVVADCWATAPLLLLCFPHSWLLLFPWGSAPSGTPLTFEDDASWHASPTHISRWPALMILRSRLQREAGAQL